jgi:hypothetical protein
MGQCVPKCFKSTISSDSLNVVIEDQAIQRKISSETAAATSIKETYSTRPLRVRTVQNFTLLWLDSNIDENDADCKNSLIQLRRSLTLINVRLFSLKSKTKRCL